jgi:hypothetical protein
MSPAWRWVVVTALLAPVLILIALWCALLDLASDAYPDSSHRPF